MEEIKDLSLKLKQLNRIDKYTLIFVIKHELMHKKICNLIKGSNPEIKIYCKNPNSKWGITFIGNCYSNYPVLSNKNKLSYLKLIFVRFIHFVWDLLCGFIFLESIPYNFYLFLSEVYYYIKIILKIHTFSVAQVLY